MDENLRKAKMPEFEIGKEQMENIKTVAAVSKTLAEDPELTMQIAKIFRDVAMAKERELMEQVTAALAEKVQGISPEQLKAAFNYWYIFYLPPESMCSIWHTSWRVTRSGWHV